MAEKKTYIYKVSMSRNNGPEKTVHLYARNAGIAVEFCKEAYKDKKYDAFKAVKKGESVLRETAFLTSEEERKLQSLQPEADAYAERRKEVSGG